MTCRNSDDRPVYARGLCSSCYYIARRDGRLDDYPRAIRRGVDTVEDVADLRAGGAGLFEIAQRVGIEPGSIVRTLERRALRLRRTGDEAELARLSRDLTPLRREWTRERRATA